MNEIEYLVKHSGGEIKAEDMSGTLLRELSIILNFTYTCTKPKLETWAFLDDDGKWQGMVGDLVRDEADIGLYLFQMLERSYAVDYTIRYHAGSYAWAMKYPDSNLALSERYITTFSTEGWSILFTIKRKHFHANQKKKNSFLYEFLKKI